MVLWGPAPKRRSAIAWLPWGVALAVLGALALVHQVLVWL